MDKQNAEIIIEKYLSPVFGFALKRCKCIEDAKDLSQEIMIKAYSTLLVKDDINDVEKYIWSIAHNMLSNYYRGNARRYECVSVDEIRETLASPDSTDGDESEYDETVKKLRREIAYLSKTQRRIVIAYYFEKKKQAQIACELGISLGTVKWHLFEAKKDLKRGMTEMRETSELMFNPVKFDAVYTSGSTGKGGGNAGYFKTAISQNIVYAVKDKALSVNEIASLLGVSPVFVEDIAEHLFENCFLEKKNGKYISNILIEEMTEKTTRLMEEMYEGTSKLFAGELFDKITESGLLSSDEIECRYKDDKNYLMWAVIPYIISVSRYGMDESITFDEAATIRPDGGVNICHAVIYSKDAKPKYADSVEKWDGPGYISDGQGISFWQVDSEWSHRPSGLFPMNIKTHLLLLKRLTSAGQPLSEEETAELAQNGYIDVERNGDDCEIKINSVRFTSWGIVHELKTIADGIREKYKKEFDALKKAFIDEERKTVPENSRKAFEYINQFILYSDGLFMLYCLKELVNSGRLTPPTEEQKKSLSTLILPE